MKLDDNLNPIPDARNNSHNGGNASGSGDSGSGRNGTGELRINGASVGNGDGIGADSGEPDDDSLPLGLPGGSAKSARENDPSRNATGRSRRRGNGRGNASGSGTDSRTDERTGTEAPALDVGGPAPRPVKLSELGGKPTAKDTKLTKQFIAEGYVLAFDAIGFSVHDKSTWELERDGDALELADRTLVWLQSLDKAKSAKLEKLLAKWQPFLMLVMALVAIVGPRIAQTSAKKKNALHIQSQGKSGNQSGGRSASNGTAPAATSDPGNAGRVNEHGVSRPELSRSPEPIRANERPLRREDFTELFGETPI